MKKLTVLQHNACQSNSIYRNFAELEPDIVALSEPPVDICSPYRMVMDTNSSPKSAILVLNKNIQFTTIYCTQCITGIKVNKSNLRIFSIYIPWHRSKEFTVAQSTEILKEVMSILSREDDKTLILGDMNAQTFLLNENSCARGKILEEMIYSHNWRLLNTPGVSTLVHRSLGPDKCLINDWSISSEKLLKRCKWSIAEDKSKSDHKPILLNLDIEAKKTPSKKFCIIKASGFLTDILKLRAPQDIADALDKIEAVVEKNLMMNRTSRDKSFYNNDIRINKKNINRTLKAIRRASGLSQLKLKDHLKSLNKKHRELLDKSKTEMFAKMAESEDGVYKTWRFIKKSQRSRVDHIIVNNETIDDPDEMASIVLNHFFPQDKTGEELRYFHRKGRKSNPLTNIEIETAINEQLNNCPGPDRLNTVLIKAWYRRDPTFLNALFNYWFINEMFPDKLGTVAITLLKKKENKPNTLNNLRPIGLSNVIAKIYERLILKRLLHHVHSNNLLSDFQYAYRSDRSTDHALHRIESLRQFNKAEKINETIISLDVSGAFNNILHSSILYYLCKLNTPCEITNILIEYLNHRIVKLNNSSQIKVHMKKGVTQGCVMGPSLFTITLDRVLTELNTAAIANGIKVEIITYADDINLLLYNYSNLDKMKQIKWLIMQTQNFLKHIGLSLSLEKIQIMESSRNMPDDFHIKIDNKYIYNRLTCNILGITFEYNGYFNSHIKNLRKKVILKMFTVCRLIRSKYATFSACEKLSRATLYKIVTYAAHVWYKSTNSLDFVKKITSIDLMIWRTITHCRSNFSFMSSLVIRQSPPLIGDVEYIRNITLGRIQAAFEINTPPSLMWNPSATPIIVIRKDITTAEEKTTPYDYIIYTDASKMSDEKKNIGCGMVCYNFNKEIIFTCKFAIQRANSVYQGELVCILRALIQARKRNLTGTVVIASDCKSAISTISKIKKKTLLVKGRILNQYIAARSTGIFFEFLWCKAHCGLEGNEFADKLAKEATEHKEWIKCPISKKLYSKSIREFIEMQWKDMYESSRPEAHIKMFFPEIDSPKKMSISFNKYNTPFYSGNGPFLSDISVTHNEVGTKCKCNHPVQDVEHILYNCELIIEMHYASFVTSGMQKMKEKETEWKAVATSKCVHEYINTSGKSILETLKAWNKDFKPLPVAARNSNKLTKSSYKTRESTVKRKSNRTKHAPATKKRKTTTTSRKRKRDQH